MSRTHTHTHAMQFKIVIKTMLVYSATLSAPFLPFMDPDVAIIIIIVVLVIVVLVVVTILRILKLNLPSTEAYC